MMDAEKDNQANRDQHHAHYGLGFIGQPAHPFFAFQDGFLCAVAKRKNNRRDTQREADHDKRRPDELLALRSQGNGAA